MFGFATPAPAAPSAEEAPRGASMLERLGVAGAVQKLNARADSLVETSQNYQTGLLVIGAGFAFMLLALLFLPLFVVKPHKFCALYSLGTATIFGGVVIIKGRGMASTLLSKRYALFTLLFAASFACEFYFAVFNPRYLLVILFLALHTVSALYLLLAAVPGGTRLLNGVFGLFFASARQAVLPERRLSLSI